MSTFGHYANFLNGLVIRNIPAQQLYSGKVWWVNNSTVFGDGGIAGSDSNTGTYTKPYATIMKAYSQVTTGRGDIILVMPGHAETVSDAGTTWALNKAGVAIVGLGAGALMPSLTIDTGTSSTIAVSGGQNAFKNIHFNSNFASIVSMFTLTTAKDFIVDSCYFDSGSSKDSIALITTDTSANHADGLYFGNNTWIDANTADALNAISVAGTNDHWVVENNFIRLGVHNNTPALINILTTKLLTSTQISNNKAYRLNTSNTGGGLVFTDGSTNTGYMYGNYLQTLDVTSKILIAASSGFANWDNKYGDAVTTSAFLIPAVGS